MQNRYVGDIGDYVKYGLLRALCPGFRLGVAWYLYPDEEHNGDGRHIRYLDDTTKWRGYDLELFDALVKLVRENQRSVDAVASAGILPGATFSAEPLFWTDVPPRKRKEWRSAWFERTLDRLAPCDMVFADPDNGLCLDEKFRPTRRKDWKRLPLYEAARLAHGHRSTIIYHHNTRFKGGHKKEIRHWLALLPKGTMALYSHPFSCRTFFIAHAPRRVRDRARAFARKWTGHVELLGP